MISTELRGGGVSYPVVIGRGLLATVGDRIKERLAPARCATISDTNVGPRFAVQLQNSLRAAGFEPTLITVRAGEHSKTLEQAGAICEQMLEAGLHRQSFVIGLGGGVIGDLSGFVAAIFERGIPHAQIPTTLLAMVDSSIGGKTGVNTRAGKNLIGAIHHPSLVIDDVDLLQTLSRRELNQGYAEIIKHAIIADPGVFKAVEDITNLAPLIKRNVEIKARIIANDERDRTGQRAILNFGHTVGHAIESAGDYKTFLHGEAIGLGMIAAAIISEKRAGLKRGERDAIVDVLSKFGLPTKLPANFPREKIYGALKFDKKFEAGKIRFVVTPKIGSANLSHDVTMEDIREAVERL